MAKSQQSFNKKERDKKRKKKKQDKLDKRERRKVERGEAGKKSFEELLMYLDEDGNLTPEKPDPTKKRKEIKAEDIPLGMPMNTRVDLTGERTGKVKFFNDDKGYGFIIDKETKESYFVHINDTYSDIKENHKVKFELAKGDKGMKAVKVEQL